MQGYPSTFRLGLMAGLVLLGLISVGLFFALRQDESSPPAAPAFTPRPTLNPAVAALATIQAAPTHPPIAEARPLDEEAQAGQALYQANCASCHGTHTGDSVGNLIGKELRQNPFVQSQSDPDLLQFIITGRAADHPQNSTGIAMPPRGGNPALTDDELMQIIAYLRLLQSADALPAEFAAADAPPINNSPYIWQQVAGNLDSPLFVTYAPDGSGRLFVVEQAGLIMLIEAGRRQPSPFLDITRLLPDAVYEAGYTEQGLLGLAFHPNYAENGAFFISYTNREGHSVLARYRVSPENPAQADPDSAEILLTIEQPFPDHNGGHLAFGPDGYLYLGMGDGGRPAEPNYNAQTSDLLLGKMLRLDVNNAPGYSVPADNPFRESGDYLPEVWALGLRNPWRFSFDRATGDLYIGDVGQWLLEELNFQAAAEGGGQNYGWSAYEADQAYLDDATLSGGALRFPILSYPHDVGCAITGGYVYRGEALPDLQGQYIYGDYCSGKIWTAQRDAEGEWQSSELMDSDFVIASFGEDEQGELYLVDYKGAIYRLVAGTSQG